MPDKDRFVGRWQTEGMAMAASPKESETVPKYMDDIKLIKDELNNLKSSAVRVQYDHYYNPKIDLIDNLVEKIHSQPEVSVGRKEDEELLTSEISILMGTLAKSKRAGGPFERALRKREKMEEKAGSYMKKNSERMQDRYERASKR